MLGIVGLRVYPALRGVFSGSSISTAGAIETDEFVCGRGVSSKLNADWEFLTNLRDVGREQAGRWLAENFDRLSNESTADIRARFL